MAIWVVGDGRLISTVREPHLGSVITVLAERVEDLLQFKHVAPLPPFTPIGTHFGVGLHIPDNHVFPKELKQLASKDCLEVLDRAVSEWPVAWYWEGFRQRISEHDLTGDEFESDYGYVWPDPISEVIAALESDGWEQITLLPDYHLPLELLTPEARASIVAQMNKRFDDDGLDEEHDAGDLENE